jgi:hypothetical protein
MAKLLVYNPFSPCQASSVEGYDVKREKSSLFSQKRVVGGFSAKFTFLPLIQLFHALRLRRVCHLIFYQFGFNRKTSIFRGSAVHLR